MYFIINQVNRVVAADSNLLKLLSVESMDELYTKIVLGEIEFSSPLDKEVTIKTSDKNEHVFDTENIVLSGMLGDLTLVSLKSNDEANEIAEEISLDITKDSLDIPEESNNESLALDTEEEEMDEDKLLAIALGTATGYAVSESLSANDAPKLEEESLVEVGDSISLLNDDDDSLDLGLDIFEEKESTVESITNDSISDSISLIEEPLKENDTISLIDNSEENVSLIDLDKDESTDIEALESLENITLDEYDNTPIIIDVEKIGTEMGLSGAEYNTFLNEYIDTALSLEEDLRSKDDVKFSNAAATLSQLSKVLHLPMIEKIVETIENSSLFEKEDHVKLLYATLARLTTSSHNEQVTTESVLGVNSAIEADNDEINFFKNNDLSIESEERSIELDSNLDIPALDIGSPDDSDNETINLDSTFDDAKIELNKEAGLTEDISKVIEDQETETETENKDSFISSIASTIGIGGAAALTIDQLTEEAEEKKEEAHEEEEKAIDNDTFSLDSLEEKIEEPGTRTAENHSAINLKDITPIHFDFQLSQAANDLSLPVELIEEFVNDFIEQAEVESVNMLDAYEKGDLDSMQKIGHLLKGASSNLRIVPLSDTLYKIQFCEDINDMEHYIKDYWGHFISFRTQMNLMSR